MLCYVYVCVMFKLCYAMLCLCYVMLCCVVLCYVMFVARSAVEDLDLHFGGASGGDRVTGYIQALEACRAA